LLSIQKPILRDLESDIEVLAIFHGPDAYISHLGTYEAGDRERLFPHWNYTVVHAYGSLRIIDDASWIRTQLEALTTQKMNELFLRPWAVSDAPYDFTEKLIEAIVGIEMVITPPIWQVESKSKSTSTESGQCYNKD